MPEPDPSTTSSISEEVKTWTMLFITVVFVILYALTVVDVIKASNAVQNLQPIVFVIVGYFFGRLPAAKVENSLKEQIVVQSNAAAAARQSEKVAATEREMLEEKVKNARIALDTIALESSVNGSNNAAAIRILSS